MRAVRGAIARVLAVSLVVAFGTFGASLVAVTAANADTGLTPPGVQQRTPNMVTADALPTVQIDNGVVWTTLVVGNTVYAGGEFSNARPAGAAPGTNLIPRSNLLAFNLTTGNLVTSFAPTINGTVKSLALSPDGSTLYVGGSFNSVDGTTHYNLAAFSTATGALVTGFKAQIGGSYVNAIAATSTAVYVGGLIGAADGTARKNLAAVDTAGRLLNWAPTTDLQVDAMTLTPNKDKLIIGGRFGQVNGVTQRGLAALSLTDGSMLPWAAPNTVIDGGGPDPTSTSYGKAGIYSLTADSNAVYGTGWVYANTTIGNLEGSFSANPDTGAINWIDDCHGDTYSAYSDGTDVYEVSHKHDCSSLGAYPNATPAPGNMTHMQAFTAAVQGTLTHPDVVSSIYKDWAGWPAPAMVNFYPAFVTGSFTGQGQAAWTLAGNGQYVVAGGEFPYVNGKLQQGLVRFATKPISGAHVGPHLGGNQWVPTAISISAGTARISVPQNYDYDDLDLTYQIKRRGTSAPVYSATLPSPFWTHTPITFTDTGLTPGQTYEYQVTATDSDGNTALSNAVDVTVSTTAISPYAQSVINDGSSLYWRLSGSGPDAGIDWAGANDGAVGSGVSPASGGAIAGDANGASTFSGTASGLVATQNTVAAPAAFSLEFWIRTTSTTGGKIIGYGSAASGDSSSYDRHVYMTNSGQLVFGVYPGKVQTVSTSASYNDGNWHYVVASQGSGGMALYVDGKRVGLNTSAVTAQSYAGYWRVGGDNLNGWPNKPTSEYFTGDVDDVSVYPTALSLVQVDTHYQLAGGSITVPTAPADAYGAAVYKANPELYWRLDDASGATTAADSGPYGVAGGVQGGVTFGQAGIQSPGTAAQFDGTSGVIVSSLSVSNPSVYSEEAWFKTTTTAGGKIIGFGNAASGLSSNYDRHVYMQDNGQLVFGTYTGQTNTIVTPSSYNDGAWHQVVATQGPDGMSLYVDGSLVGTNPQTAAQAYTGYWRIGGDQTWGSTSPYFAGTIDEAAVFDHELTAADVSTEYELGSGVTPPTAAFSAQADQLVVTFDSSASQAFNGATISGYSWDFGDGSSSTDANPSHTYASPGDYQVTLTVTDSTGHTGTTAKTVTVTQHAAPTVDIKVNTSGLTSSFDGTGSTAADSATIQSYAWDFGDGATSTNATPTHTYAASGSYTVSLTVTDSLGGVGTASTTVDATHAAPVATFTATPGSAFSVSVDGSGSTASDGATLSYSWDWGDGTALGSGVTATHSYASAGSYTITLTVTDSLGATSTSSSSADVTHAAPVAIFSATPGSNDSLSVDASASTASDGATLTYAWDWGDGSATGSGVTATHTYAAAGSYTVKLTVTDSLGASSGSSQSVNVSSNQPYASDSFARTLTGGWGSADVGGAWTLGGSAASFAVNGSAGTMTMPAPGTGEAAGLAGVSQTDTETSVSFSLNKPQTGGGTYVSVIGRRVSSSSDYRVKLRVMATGQVTATLERVVGNTETGLAAAVVAGLTYTAGDLLDVRLQVTGTSPTTLSAMVWKDGTTEPTNWQLTDTDNTAVLQVPGGVGLNCYLSGSSTSAPETAAFENLWAGPGSASVASPPVADFVASLNGLTASFDASGSQAPAGSITSYAWSFGDGTTGTGVAPSHAYAAGGTYTVTLTVTDNVGATSTSTQTVTVGMATPIAADTFSRAVSANWGTADLGGAWTDAVGFSVANGVGLASLPAATTRNVYLGSVDAQDVDSTVQLALDRLPTGGSAHFNLLLRSTSAGDYRAKVVVGSTGGITVYIGKYVGTTETILAAKSISGYTYTAGAYLDMRFQLTTNGASSVLKVMVWPDNGTVPTDWLLTVSDNQAELQVPGRIGLSFYVSKSTQNGPIGYSINNLQAVKP